MRPGYFSRIDTAGIWLSRWVLNHRIWVLLTLLVVTAFLISGVRFLELANNYRAFFSDENPELRAFESLQATYTKNDNFLFIIDPKHGGVFTPEVLSAIEWLTAEAWQIPHASRVDSLSNFQHTYAIADDLIVEDLVLEAASLSADQIEDLREIALSEPLLNGLLVTNDSRVAAVNVTLQYPEQSLTEVPDSVQYARHLRSQLEAEYPSIDVSITGVSMLNNAFSEAGLHDMQSLVPLMFLTIIVLAIIMLRSLVAVFAIVTVMVLSSLTAMGLGGFLGIQLTPISTSAPIVIMTLAIADSIHILITLRAHMRAGLAKNEALVEAIRLNILPVSVTSLTTIVGFLTLNFTDSPPFWHLGNLTAMGILAAWLLSLTLLPVLISLLPYRVNITEKGTSKKEWLMRQLTRFVVSHAGKILVVVGLLSMVLTSLISGIELNDQWVEYFDERIEFRRDSDHALNYVGMYPIEYSVPAASVGGVSEPEYLESLERFVEFLNAQPEVTHVYGISDIMKRLNKNLHGDNQEYYQIPQERDLSAQYLLLYELSLPYGLDLNDRINIDKSASRVTATLDDLSTANTKAFLERTEQWVHEHLPEYMHAMKPTSAQVMFTYISDRNVHNMIDGTLVAVLAIAVIMMIALRHIGIGLLSLIPNSLPILTTFGAWYLLVGEVGFSVSTVASISLGIIVDDTVHLLTKFVRAQKELGRSVVESIEYAFQQAGVAILVNTVVLSCGFLVLTFSAFKVNVDMGLLTALSIVFALILDFLFLPALLVFLLDNTSFFSRKRGKSKMAEKLPSHTIKSVILVGVFVSVSMLTIGYSPALSAETQQMQVSDSEKKGFEIAALSDRSDRGFADSQVDLAMVLRNAAGEETTRELTINTLEVQAEDVGDKSLVKFNAPGDIKGTALLSHANILDPDDQWLFLPALKRVKRISSKNKSGPFVGSEFAFEDFTSLELNKYTYEWLQVDTCQEFTCDVIVRYPRYKNSGYTKQIAWIDQEHHQVRRVDYYNRQNMLLKTLTLTEYRQYGEYWRAHLLHMINHQNRKETELRYSNYQFNTGLKASDFIKSRLASLR